MCKKGWILLVMVLASTLLLAAGAVGEPAPDGAGEAPGAQAKYCLDRGCGDGCLSAWSCRGKSSGQECKAAGLKGKCAVLRTCWRGACCGCKAGSLTFLDGGTILGADGRFYGLDGAPLETADVQVTGGGWREVPVVFRVYDHQGSPVHNAEVLVRGTYPPWANARGTTVQGLFQTFLPCSGNSSNWPGEIHYHYEVWSAAGKVFRGSWWQSTSATACSQTKDVPVRLSPPLATSPEARPER